MAISEEALQAEADKLADLIALQIFPEYVGKVVAKLTPCGVIHYSTKVRKGFLKRGDWTSAAVIRELQKRYVREYRKNRRRSWPS